MLRTRTREKQNGSEDYDAESSNGRTADSGSVREGSNPSSAANFTPRWSRGSGRRPLTAKIAGSNPARGTI